jgi:tetratricopeptide (TPR) repeat protein
MKVMFLKVVLTFLVIILIFPCSAFSYYGVENGGIAPIPKYENPYNSPSYDGGFGDGYIDGYKDSYPDAYLRAKQDDDITGKNDGKKNGFDDYVNIFLNYKFPGLTLIELLNKTEFENDTSPKMCEINFGDSKNYYSQGYNDGLVIGRKKGGIQGRNDGHTESYKAEYGKSYKENYELGMEYISYYGDKKLTANDQFQMGVESFNNENYKEAIIRFNVILKATDPSISKEFKFSTLWWLALSKEQNSDYNESARLFLIHYEELKEVKKEEVILNIARNLLSVETDSGFGKTKYYNKALEIMKCWTEKFKNSQLFPEGLFILGESFDRVGKKEEANKIYIKIIEEYPQTSFAVESKIFLEEVQ